MFKPLVFVCFAEFGSTNSPWQKRKLVLNYMIQAVTMENPQLYGLNRYGQKIEFCFKPALPFFLRLFSVLSYSYVRKKSGCTKVHNKLHRHSVLHFCIMYKRNEMKHSALRFFHSRIFT